MVSVGPRPILLLWVFLPYELPVFVLMLLSVSSPVMFLCFMYCLKIVLLLSYSVLWPPSWDKYLLTYLLSSDSASFLVLPSAYSQDPGTDFYAQYVKWRLFAQGCAFGGLENKILYFDPTSLPPKNRNYGPIFDGTKRRLKKALTTGMLTCKLPVIVIVAPWRLYSSE